MAKKFIYGYTLPKKSFSKPKMPTSIKYRQIVISDNTMTVLVTLAGHNYLKNKSYAKFVGMIGPSGAFMSEKGKWDDAPPAY